MLSPKLLRIRSIRQMLNDGSESGRLFSQRNTKILRLYSVSDPLRLRLRRVAVGEAAVNINGEWFWVSIGIDLDTKVDSGVDLYRRYGADPAAVFLVDGFGYQTTLA